MRGFSKAKYYYALTFVSPLIGTYLAIRNLQWPWRKSVLILAITLFGSTIILQSSDGFVLRQYVYTHYMDLGFDQWLFELKEMLLFNPQPGTKGDVYSHVLSYIVGHILGIPGQYFIFVSFVYAYFYVTAMSRVLRWNRRESHSALFWFLVIIFISYRFINNLQTVRTWTGLWVLFNGVYGYHQTGKLKYLVLMLMAPMFHVAYFVIALPAYAVIFIRRLSPRFFVLLYAISFFMTVNPAGIIENLRSTKLGKEKVAGYYQEDPDEYYSVLNSTTANFYTKYGKGWSLPNAPHFMAGALILMGMFSKRRMNKLELGVFSTGLLIATMANIGSFIPVFYDRTMVNAGIYITATTVILLQRGELLRSKLLWRKFLLWSSVATFIPYLIYTMADMLQFTSIYMLVVPLMGFVDEFNLSIRELIGFLLF